MNLKTIRVVIPERTDTEQALKRRDDIDHIVSVLAKYGYFVTLVQAQLLWKLASKSVSASWLILGDDNNIMRTVQKFIEVVE